jgi:arylsulfatase A-like enzyme
VFATIAEIAGVEPPPKTDGISFRPTLVSGHPGRPYQNEHEFLYWEFHERGFQQAARMGKWKGVILKRGGKLELYNLGNDIGEEHNVADKHPEVVAKIEAHLKTARTENPDWPIRPAPRAKGKGKSKGRAKAN